ANNGLANNGLANNGLANNGLANNGLANNGLVRGSFGRSGLDRGGITTDRSSLIFRSTSRTQVDKQSQGDAYRQDFIALMPHSFLL
ncbi:MAG: hypothetical protein C0617_07335, partial [Desulfuromonas sp.]